MVIITYFCCCFRVSLVIAVWLLDNEELPPIGCGLWADSDN